MGITLGNALLSLGSPLLFHSILPHFCRMRKSFPSLSLGGVPIGRKRERPYKTAWVPMSCCFELDLMCIFSLLQHIIERISLSRTNCQRLLLLNWASKSFTSSPDVSVFWTNRKHMYSWLSLKIWASTEEGGVPHLPSGTRRLQEQAWSRSLPKRRL